MYGFWEYLQIIQAKKYVLQHYLREAVEFFTIYTSDFNIWSVDNEASPPALSVGEGAKLVL